MQQASQSRLDSKSAIAPNTTPSLSLLSGLVQPTGEPVVQPTVEPNVVSTLTAQHTPAAGVGPTKSLPGNIRARLRAALSATRKFAYDDGLKALFIDERIATWRCALPEAKSEADRIAQTISYLYEHSSPQGDNGLALLLHVLAEETAPSDALQQQLLQLATEVQAIADQQEEALQNARRAQQGLQSEITQLLLSITDKARAELYYEDRVRNTLQKQLCTQIQSLTLHLPFLEMHIPTTAAHVLWDLYAIDAPLIKELYIAEMYLVTELKQFTQAMADFCN